MKERRLLDEHVLAAGERLLRQIEVEARGDGDDHAVNAAIRKGPKKATCHGSDMQPFYPGRP